MPQQTQTLAPITGPHVKAKVTAPQPKPKKKLANAPTISSHWKGCISMYAQLGCSHDIFGESSSYCTVHSENAIPAS